MQTGPVVTTALVLLAVPALPAGVAAQDTVPQRGAWGLRFALPEGGGGAVGAVKFLSDRTSLGLDISFSYRSDALAFSSERDPGGQEREATSWHVGVAPELRRYLVSDRSVAPFVIAGGGLQYNAATRGEDRRADAWTLSVRTGVGAEWFPTDGVSVGGSTGVRVRRRTEEQEQDDPQAERSSSAWGVDAFRSSLLLSLYF